MGKSWSEVEQAARRFSEEWKDARYEKGDTQSFYNDFFEIFGLKRRQVARFEEHVRLNKATQSAGFIDLFWPGVLIAEQKSKGRDLTKAELQAGEYFDALPVGQQPRYQLVCDFQSFILVDRDEDERIEFELPELHKHVRSFAFMLGRQPLKARVRTRLNIQAAHIIGSIYDALSASGYDRESLERLLTRLVYCLFADNTGIFSPRGAFADLVEASAERGHAAVASMLVHLFEVLETPVDRRQKNLPDGLGAFPHVNGGLFADPIRIPVLNDAVVKQISAACDFDWSAVSPAVFGALFQAVLSDNERRDLGAYSTSEENILRVLRPLFIDNLRAEFDALVTRVPYPTSEVKAFRERLTKLSLFDPACGCGNFLVVAYRALRAIELETIVSLKTHSALNDAEIVPLVSVDQVFGIERREYSAKIAETAIWMTDHLANLEHSARTGVEYSRIPLEGTPFIECGDALELPWHAVCPPTSKPLIMGNPPYKGPKQQSSSERAQVRRVANLGGDGGTLDYSAAWVLKAADYVSSGAVCGFVTTNSLVQGEQAGQLWPVLFKKKEVEIGFAHQQFRWSSDSGSTSSVHVVILGLRRKGSSGTCRLWLYPDPTGMGAEVKCKSISPYLVVGDKLSDPECVVTRAIHPLNGLPKLKTGTKPIDGGYYIFDAGERKKLLQAAPQAAAWVRPFVGTTELLEGTERYILVLEGVAASAINRAPAVLRIVESVRKWRSAQIPGKSGGPTRKNADQLANRPTSFHLKVFPSAPFLVVPEVSSENRVYIPIAWLRPPTIPSNLVKCLLNATPAHFGLLTSAMHMAWVRRISGRLEARYRYSIGIAYNTFPVAISLTDAKLLRLSEEILKIREHHLQSGNTLEDIYSPTLMPADLRRAHEQLDRYVDSCYLGRAAVSEDERLENLLNRYHGALAAANQQKQIGRVSARRHR